MNARLVRLIEACAAGSMPPNVALMQMMMAARDETDVVSALDDVEALSSNAGKRLREMQNLARAHPHAFAVVKRIAGCAEHAAPASPDEGLSFWVDLYDRLARDAPEAAVALYTFGSPDLLARATDEVVERLREWRLIDSSQRVLDIGCGHGRFLRALAPDVAGVTGVDVSAGMLARARQACAGLANVALVQGSGRDLAELRDESFDLVLAVDAFPFIVDARLEREMMAEAARVLAPGGRIAIFNFSYRGDCARDVAEVQRLFAENGLAIERRGTRDLALWDAIAFVGRKLTPPSVSLLATP